MNKEKQIEEMAKVIASVPPIEFPIGSRMQGRLIYTTTKIAEHLYNAGYRRQSENTIELPCKVGDTVWHIRRTPEHRGGSYIVEAKIICIPIRVYPNEVYFDLILRYTQRNGMPEEASSILGKYAFPTKEEAEQTLAKMKGGAE